MRRVAGPLVVAVAFSLRFATPATATTTQQRSGPFLYVTVSDDATAGDFAQLAGCPTGFKMTGGGGALGKPVTDSDDNSRLTSSVNETTTSFRIRGFNDLGAGGHAAIATAACIKATSAAAIGYTTDVSSAANGIRREAQVCPTGTQAIGGGVDMGTLTDEEFLSASLPQDKTSWFTQAFNGSTTRNVVDGSICVAEGTVKVRFVKRSVVVQPDKRGTAKVSCPSTFRVASGGFAMSDFSHLIASLPFDGSDADHAPDDGWKASAINSDPSPMALTAYAVCLK